MIENIINGIASALDDAFPNCEVYTDSVQQGVAAPCFQILTQTSIRSRCGADGLRSCINAFDVIYFPLDEDDRAAMMVVGESIHDALEIISVSDSETIRATGVEFSIQDGLLHFMCNYNHHEMTEDDDIDYMETMESVEVEVNGN